MPCTRDKDSIEREHILCSSDKGDTIYDINLGVRSGWNGASRGHDAMLL
jgi:hypothetical protein